MREPWEQRKIGDLFKEVKRPIKLQDNQIYQLVTVKRRNGGVISRTKEFGKDILVKNYYEIQNGDFLISKRQVVHGANGYVPENLTNAVVSNEYLIATSTPLITTKFWTLISKTRRMYQLYFLSSYGVDIEKLVFDVEDWKKRSILVPKIEEQNYLTNFFEDLDCLIELNRKQLDFLKEQKKGLLQKMFPKEGNNVPELRFPEFTVPWEQRKLGELAPLRGGFAFKSENYIKDGIPIIRISNILSDGSIGSNFTYYSEQNDDDSYLLKNGAILIAMSGATTGKVAILKCPNEYKYYQNQRVGYFIPISSCDYKFISIIVQSQSFKDQLNSILVSGTQPNVSAKDIDSFKGAVK